MLNIMYNIGMINYFHIFHVYRVSLELEGHIPSPMSAYVMNMGVKKRILQDAELEQHKFEHLKHYDTRWCTIHVLAVCNFK